MHSPYSVRKRVPAPRVRGAIDVAQGAYGQRGNLELVAPDSVDGFVVLWFNGDDEEPPTGVAKRSWSAGLHVTVGARLDGARIAQISAGPQFLEVTVVAANDVRRWFWTPTDGFVAGGSVGQSICIPSAIVEEDDGLHMLASGADGVVLYSAALERYPDVHWRVQPLPFAGPARSVDLIATGYGLLALVVAPDGTLFRLDRSSGGTWAAPAPLSGRWRSARLLDATGAMVGIRADGRADALGVVISDGGEEVAGTRSSLDAGMVEVVGRRGDTLLHTRIGVAAESTRFHVIEPCVWATPADRSEQVAGNSD